MTDDKLDSLIAEHIYGYTKNNPPKGCLCSMREECSTCVWPNTLNYSTQIEYAFLVLQEITKSGEFCCVKLESDYDIRWDVLVVDQGDENHKYYHLSF